MADLPAATRLTLAHRDRIHAFRAGGACPNAHLTRIAVRIALRSGGTSSASARAVAYAARSARRLAGLSRGRRGALVGARRHAPRACGDLAEVARVWRRRAWGAHFARSASSSVAVDAHAAGVSVGNGPRNRTLRLARRAVVALLDARHARIGAVAAGIARNALARIANVRPRVAR